jgi:hypothetical protein
MTAKKQDAPAWDRANFRRATGRRPTQKQIDPPTQEQIDAWPKDWQNDHWETLGLDAFVEVHGRAPGTPPGYDDCVTELDGWAVSPEGRRELRRRGITPWW